MQVIVILSNHAKRITYKIIHYLNFSKIINSLYNKILGKLALQGGEFFVNVLETNYRRMDPPLQIVVCGTMGIGQFIHKVVETLGKFSPFSMVHKPMSIHLVIF